MGRGGHGGEPPGTTGRRHPRLRFHEPDRIAVEVPVERALQEQDALGRCGILLKPGGVMTDLRRLAARRINVRLPDALFRSLRLPAHLEREVTLGNTTVALSVGGAPAGTRVGVD